MSRLERQRQQEEFRIQEELIADAMCIEPRLADGWLLSYDIHPTFTPWEIWHVYHRENVFWLRYQKVLSHHHLEIEIRERRLMAEEADAFEQRLSALYNRLPADFVSEIYARDGTRYRLIYGEHEWRADTPLEGFEKVLGLGKWLEGLA